MAEELPSSRCFCVVGDTFFSTGSKKVAILASQWHAQVISPATVLPESRARPSNGAIIISQGAISAEAVL